MERKDNGEKKWKREGRIGRERKGDDRKGKEGGGMRMEKKRRQGRIERK